MSKTQEKKRARGSSSTVEEDVTDKMILEKLSNIHADVKALKDELKSEIQALKSELSEVTKSLNAVWDEVQSLKQKYKQDQCDAAARENSKLNEEIKKLKLESLNWKITLREKISVSTIFRKILERAVWSVREK